jgi:hypothetical protein
MRYHPTRAGLAPAGTRLLGLSHLYASSPGALERLFAWLSRYRRLNIVFDREPDLFAAHVWIAMISIIARRLVAQTQPQ